MKWYEKYSGFLLILMVLTILILLSFLLIENLKRKKADYLFEQLDKNYTKELGERIKLQLAYETLNKELYREKDQKQEITRLHDNTRRLKHDMKNHILVITSYLNSHLYSEAQEYLSLILDQLNKIHTYIETGNSILNYIINTKLESAKQEGINIKAEIENIQFERMGSVDFSSLLSNMLDNAIEASVLEENKELHVIISKKRGYDTIMVKNRISKSVLEKNPDLISLKTSGESHGYGIKQIKLIVEKYEGIVDFYEENNFFCVHVMILSQI